jgi:iron complex outermembrane receptor protein
VGSANLSSEKGYFVDCSVECQKGQFSAAVSQYLYYFTNYIFLAPTGEWSKLPHAGQIYRYMQSAAVMGGLEVSTTQEFGKHLELLINGEWLMNKQVGNDGDYPLPFSPPANIFAELSYKLKPEGKLGSTKVSVHCKKAFEQNRIARNEAVTPGYQIIGLGLHTTIKTVGRKLLVDVQAHNIFNTKYYNHISFYRKLEIPEPGRNIQVLLSMPF